jgi:hypothetical protein
MTETTVEPLKTEGLSPKAVLAAVLPTLGGVVAVAVQWVATGEFDRAELATALSAVCASALAFLGAYLARAGRVVVALPAAPVPAAGAGAKHTGIE